MKRLFALVIALCMTLSLGTYSVVAAEGELPKDEKLILLSTLNDEECRAFLLEQGVTIPEEFKDFDFPKFFSDIEKDPDMPIVLGWTALAEFSEEVRAVVNGYYGIEETPTARASTYTLQYSTLHLWEPGDMPYYNCYAYALGLTYTCRPGDFSGQTYNDDCNIATLATLVKDDLNGNMGYDCVKIQSSRPSSMGVWWNIVAVRKDTTDDYYDYSDFHVAKFLSSKWYHKPGGTAVLKFNNAPSNSVDWTNEHYDGTYHEPTITYDSDLRYLLFKRDHGNTTYTWTGEHYHSGTNHYYIYAYKCNDCGDYVSLVRTSTPCSGPPCSTPWSLTATPVIS